MTRCTTVERGSRRRPGVLWLAGLLALVVTGAARAEDAKPARTLRAGLIGLDTSHVIAFTNVLNKKASGDLAGVKVVAGYPGGSDIAISRNRVAKFTEQLRGMGVEIVDSLPALLEKVDVVLLESVDGRQHLEQARPVIKAGKPLFIDKPAGGSLADVIAIYELARKHRVPCFSSSSLRYSPSLQKLRGGSEVGAVAGAVVWGPCSIEPSVPDLYFYGVHGVEALYALMGTGCETVTRAHTRDTDVVTGVWKDGRVGTYRGIRRHPAGFGAMVFGTKGIVRADAAGGYEPLLREVVRFFQTGKPPVSPEETIELFAFLDAAEESKRQGGAPVSLAKILAKARAEAGAAK